MQLDEAMYLAELELMEAAYGEEFQLIQSDEVKGASFTIDLKVEDFFMNIKFNVPVDYPEKSVKFDVDGNVNKSEKVKLMAMAAEQVESNPEIGCMELVQFVSDVLDSGDIKNNSTQADAASNDAESSIQCSDISIARFLVYFHHIERSVITIFFLFHAFVVTFYFCVRSESKRKIINEAAQQYSLGGFCKHGYPGVVIIEGQFEHVLEFVNDIRKLRWKNMVVRGEEIDVLRTVADGAQDLDKEGRVEMINKARKLPPPPTWLEFETMADVGQKCKSSDMHDLFQRLMLKR